MHAFLATEKHPVLNDARDLVHWNSKEADKDDTLTLYVVSEHFFLQNKYVWRQRKSGRVNRNDECAASPYDCKSIALEVLDQPFLDLRQKDKICKDTKWFFLALAKKTGPS